MFSTDEIKLKIKALEDEAAKVGEPEGAGYREIGMGWRLVEIEAVFMQALREASADDQPPPTRKTNRGSTRGSASGPEMSRPRMSGKVPPETA